jgi:hypothetical protein
MLSLSAMDQITKFCHRRTYVMQASEGCFCGGLGRGSGRDLKTCWRAHGRAPCACCQGCRGRDPSGSLWRDPWVPRSPSRAWRRPTASSSTGSRTARCACSAWTGLKWTRVEQTSFNRTSLRSEPSNLVGCCLLGLLGFGAFRCGWLLPVAPYGA